MMIHVVAAVIVQEGKVLLAKRPLDKHQGGKWEFPGGKREEGELPDVALKRECLEELGIHLSRIELFESVEHNYLDKHVFIEFYKVESFSGEPTGLEGQAVEWVSLHQLNELTFPEANLSIVNKLRQSFV